uniref:SAP domain-containing protein n=1 Tax=viral metagenome TaxID=1070528 RepID=A0A6C0K3F3_9ZZZZ
MMMMTTTSLYTELPKAFMAKKHIDSMNVLSDAERLWLDKPFLLQTLATLDYACVTEVPFFLFPVLFSTLTKEDVDGYFSRSQWIRQDLLVLLECHGQETVYERALFACEKGCLPYLRYMHDLRIMPLVSNMLIKALHSPDMMDWLLEKGARLDETVFHAAALKGDQDMMKWLVTKKCPIDVEGAYRAVVDTHRVETLSFLLNELKLNTMSADEKEDVFIGMILNDKVDMMQWFLDQGWNLPSDFSIASFVLHNESIAALKMMDARIDLSYYHYLLMYSAIRESKMLILHYLVKEKNHPLTSSMAVDAVHYQNLPMLRWLKENGCPWVKKTCLRIATDMNNQEMAQWIREYDPLRNDRNGAFCGKTLKELKTLCREAGIAVSGTRIQLMNRLADASMPKP